MSAIPSSQAYIQTEAAQFRRPVSENLIQTIGGAVNFLNDLGTSHSSTISTHTSQIATLQTDTARTGPNSLQVQINNEITARGAADTVLQNQLNIKTNLPQFTPVLINALGIPESVSYTSANISTRGPINLGSFLYGIIAVNVEGTFFNGVTIETNAGLQMLGGFTATFPDTIQDYSNATRDIPPYFQSFTFMLSGGTNQITFSGTMTGKITIGGLFFGYSTQQVVVG